MVKIIENYALHEQIGEGEYGKVFKGVDSKTKREVAVKVINVNKFKENPKLEECTLNEIDVLSRIDSPHIVKFIEILKTANNFYFFYEYCNEGTLEQKIKKFGRLPEQLVLDYLSQMLEAFRILASRNIMHRDLKPSNILVHEGRIKIADFGFCKSLETNKDLAQTMLGSPIYMAPEVLKGEIYTVRADVWSLGVVLYEMLFGYCPYEESSIARLINLLDEQQLSFSPEVARMTPELEELIRRMLVKDQFKRITWDEIFSYRITPEGISKPSELREKKGFFNHSSTGSAGKPTTTHLQKPNNGPSSISSFSVQKKPNTGSQPPSDSNGIFKKKLNKENIGADTISNNDSLRRHHLKLVNAVRHVLELANHNYCPELTGPLGQRLLATVQKQLQRIMTVKKEPFQREMLALADTIKLFSQGASPTSQTPYLTSYIQLLQKQHPAAFSTNDPSKDMLIHVLELLEFNNLETSCLKGQKITMSKEDLLAEISHRLPSNVI